MVLHDSKGNFVWQGFDYPTDTLLVGQSLRAKGVTKLLSRASDKNNSNGLYSLSMEHKGLSMYYKGKNSPRPYLYFTSSHWFTISKGTLEYVTLNCAPDTDEGYAYDLTLDYHVANSSTSGNLIMTRPKYNSTLSFLRLGVDGNLRIYTYYDKVDWGTWEMTFTLFPRDSIWETECQLPERCGTFGLCEDNQCVTCLHAYGIVGSDKNCEPVKVPSCKLNDFYYYRVEGDHFISEYTKGDGPMTQDDCWKKCTEDCKCLGLFYHPDTSRCWIAYDLNTLTKVTNNSTHFGYIKVPNQ